MHACMHEFFVVVVAATPRHTTTNVSSADITRHATNLLLPKSINPDPIHHTHTRRKVN